MPQLAVKIWTFIKRNDNNVIVGGGMQHIILGLDKYKLGIIAEKYYGIDISRFMFFIDAYTNKLLEQQHLNLTSTKD